MCIAVLSTAHPSYALILIDNRDEYVCRPTSRPHWWMPSSSAHPSLSPSLHPSLHLFPGPSLAASAPAPESESESAHVSATPSRPTRRAHILSSRDLFHPEHGTWLGITRSGRLAVLTNFREPPSSAVSGSPGGPGGPGSPVSLVSPAKTDKSGSLISGPRSRGEIVTAWLGGEEEEGDYDDIYNHNDTEKAIRRFVKRGSLTDFGGFSMVCGCLRPRPSQRQQRRLSADVVERGDVERGDVGAMARENAILPLAVVSNRLRHGDALSWVVGVGGRDESFALSNTSHDDPNNWPKIQRAKTLLAEAIRDSVGRGLDEGLDEHALISRLFAVLDDDSLIGTISRDKKMGDILKALTTTVFVPPVGQPEDRAREGSTMFEDGVYGTQRQTVILVDWDGNVVYIERALWDEEGQPIERGQGDFMERFKIDGWDDDTSSKR